MATGRRSTRHCSTRHGVALLQRTSRLRSRRSSEQGQASILLVIVMLAGMAVAVAVAALGQAAVDQARTQVAADAIALAAASATSEADALAEWYEAHGIASSYSVDADRRSSSTATIADGGGDTRSIASAEASTTNVSGLTVPVFAAIVARAEQLLGQQFDPVAMTSTSLDLPLDEANEFAAVAPDFGICDQGTIGPRRNVVRFTRC